MFKRKKLSVEKRQSRMGYVFCLPLIIGLACLFIPNIVKTFIYSINDASISVGGHWRGFYFYNRALFENADFPQMLFSSFSEMLIQVPTIVVFSLFFASVLNQEFKGRVVARAIFFLPVILATGIVLYIGNADFLGSRDTMNDSFQAMGGAAEFNLDRLLMSLNLSEGLITFVSSAANGVYNIVNNSGMQIFILLAAFQEIPNSLYEAADVEGCTKWETFWKITIPMVSRQIVVVSVYTIIDAFTKNDSTLFTYIYTKAWEGGPDSFAYGTSMYIIYTVCLAAFLAIGAWLFSVLIKKTK